jgi:arylsulfatase A-like enzyme
MATNAVIVVLDALRADRVGVYSDRDLTPNIDTLAADGTTLDNAFSTTNTTDPAMTSLLTGLHPASHGVRNHGDRVSDEEKASAETNVFLPEILRDAGVHTIKEGRPMGRWHRNGFDEYPPLRSPSLKVRIHDAIYERSELIGEVVTRLYKGVDEVGRGFLEQESMFKSGSDDDEIVRFFDKVNSAPFFGLIHLMDTHAPYEPPSSLIEECRGQYKDDDKEVSTVIEKVGTDSLTGNILAKWSERTNISDDPTLGDLKTLYDATVRQTDRKVGELISQLKERGWYEDTAVIVLSDHGESLDEHGIYFDHHGLYDTTVRIPLVVRLPEDQARRSNEFVQITDVTPTLLDYWGIDAETKFDGKSLAPLLFDNDEWESRDGVVAEEHHTQHRRMVRTGIWKYIELTDGDTVCRYCDIEHAGPRELYNQLNDPNEMDNFIHERQQVAEGLANLADRLTEDFSSRDGHTAAKPAYDEEDALLDRLESLGYR